MTRITVIRGDITTQDVDAIVNAANERCLGGGGVDGAIHRAAGKKLVEACKQLPEVAPLVRCPTGSAVITPGFQLPARFVIHAVGPRWGMNDAPALLASAFRTSLDLAEREGLKTIALPAISCGVFRFPVGQAARIAADVSRERERALDEIRFVLFDEDTCDVFGRAFWGDAWRTSPEA
ncbi:MAG: O-acetyl-ADP-ribose deacetylase [Deltaproteobacteria bacterium]|nr:O-acetyl-ADP-ribose deacetylase [Deltaproteobacteria bacterium]